MSDGSDQDVLLGAALVGAFCILLVGTSVGLHLDDRTLSAATLVAGWTAAADLGLLLLLRHRPTNWILLSFPVLLGASVMALSLLTKGLAVDFSPFLTLAFFYVGITQRRGTGVFLALLTVPAWVLAQSAWTAGIGIRLLLNMVVWLILSDILAVRTAHGRTDAKRLISQANTDPLTGLGSRVLLSDRIETLATGPEAGRYSLLFIDLDGFKTVNDSYGHAAGDELLVVVAERLRSTLRDGDTCARLGGDEFAALLEDCDLDRATQVATRMLAALSGPIALSGGRVAVTASIGIVDVVAPATAERVLRDADLAMYEAKSSGRNRLSIYEQAMKTRMTSRLELETELRDALDAGQFEIHYQPVVHTGTGAIIGAEALLRWRHPRRGLLEPAEFLATAEDLGLMEPLGDWVLRMACHQARTWQSINPARALTMAVNLSVPELFAADLPARVEWALADAELPGTLLVLEITERVIMADAALAGRRLEELRRFGVRIAIDDFGTGYSSLAYLRQLPVDILKIDRSFVTPLGSDSQAVSLLRSIVAIAHALLLDIVVEGVETAGQAEILAELGCHIVQGYYFSRPTSAEDFGAQLAQMQLRQRSLWA